MRTSRVIDRVSAFFRSARLTAGVISALIMFYVLGLLTPQKTMFDTRELYMSWVESSLLHRTLHLLGFTDVYTAPTTFILLGLFFTNLVVVLIYRVKPVFRKAYIGAGPPEIEPAALATSASAASLAADRSDEEIEALFRQTAVRRGYAVMKGARSGTWLALKHRFSPLGFLLFHMSFILCLVGGLLISYTRFSGNIGLAEGQRFTGDMRQFHRIGREPKFLKELPALGLMVEEVRPRYDNGVPSELAATVLISDGKEARREHIDVNRPIESGPYTILVENIGVTPLIVVTDASGRAIDAAYVSLNVLGGKRDSFRLAPLPGYLITVYFYPDYRVQNGMEGTASQDLNNPAFHFVVEKDGTRVYDGTVKPGEFAAFQRYRMSVGDIRYWLDLVVVREYGATPLISGFVLASLGLVLRLVFYQKRIALAVTNDSAGRILHLDGRSEYYPQSFREEQEEFIRDITDGLRTGRDRVR